MNITNATRRDGILSRNNLILCKADYFETCWCQFNSSVPKTCPYLLRHVNSYSNSSYFCIYHTIRRLVECFNSTAIFPKVDSVSTIYVYLTIVIFTIGFIGNGLSAIILLNKNLRCLGVYRNLALLCFLNIFYLSAISIRHINNYNQDIRYISSKLCRLHTFIVAFTGHLCSWQLVSTSIQRVNALLSLQSYRTKSWTRTLGFLLFCIILPLFILDAQILFNYGVLHKYHMCDDRSSYETKQFKRAIHHALNDSNILTNISILYHRQFFASQPLKPIKCVVCILWNIIDTLVYAIIPFLIILTSSIIIIVTICRRRRSMLNIGGTCHTNQRVIAAQDNLSILLIVINFLFLIMTGPFNIRLIIQSTLNYFSSKPSSTKTFIDLNECLRLLQNSYHALSFIFYCVIGNKFRSSAYASCRLIYCKLFQLTTGQQQTQPSMFLRFLDRKTTQMNRLTTSTSFLDDTKRTLNQSNTTLNRGKFGIQDTSMKKKSKRTTTHV